MKWFMVAVVALLLAPVALAQTTITLNPEISVDIRTNNGTAIIEIGDSVNIVDCIAKTHTSFTTTSPVEANKEGLCMDEVNAFFQYTLSSSALLSKLEAENDALKDKLTILEGDKVSNGIKTSYLILSTTLAAIFLTTSIALYYRGKTTEGGKNEKNGLTNEGKQA